MRAKSNKQYTTESCEECAESEDTGFDAEQCQRVGGSGPVTVFRKAHAREFARVSGGK